jgi:glucose-1-phosphate thymidylyltransferase
MKGLILAGGRGTRLYPLTYTRAKQLIPVANEPVLFRVIRAVRDAGITEIGIVVGDTEQEIRSAVGDGARWGINATFIRQSAPRGLAHAVRESLGFLGDDRCVVFLGDNVIQGGIAPLIAAFATSGWNAQVVLKRVENPQQFGVAELDRDGSIVRLVEKPAEPKSDLALVGIYMFDHHIREAVQAIEPSTRGEYEITDAIQWLIDQGLSVHPYIHEGWWIDTGKPTDLLAANDRVLGEIEPGILGGVDEATLISGLVRVEAGAEVVNSVITGPAVIGTGARIINSRVGAGTSIYHRAAVINSHVEHSIVLEDARIEGVGARVRDSIVGRSAIISGSGGAGGVLSMELGDYSRVALGPGEGSS